MRLGPGRHREASFESHMTTMEASDWSKFFIADLAYVSNARPFYPWSFFDLGIISKKILQKPTSGARSTIFFQGSLITL